MKTKRLIRPELSAQGIRKRGNPMLPHVLEELRSLWGAAHTGKVIVDCGCGQLRHAEAFLAFSQRLVLVDTHYQLSTPHEFFGKKMLIPEVVSSRWPRSHVTLMDTAEFAKSSIHADCIFAINVLDVVPRRTRSAMIAAIVRNLGESGLFVAIAPRNDTWTMRICTQANQYEDGYIFPHKRGYTYYRNWVGSTLQDWLSTHGLRLVRDLSRYRHVCGIFSRK